MLGYILWNADPEIFSLGPLHVRYYGLMFGIGFYIGYRIMLNIVKREGLPQEWVEKLFIYTIIGTVVGARLGHCLFYQPEYYLAHPIEILKIWEGGLASHGGAIGVLTALILFSRKVSKRSVFWVLDRIVLGVALTAALIRFGNLMNSEIYGYPTDSDYGFVYLKDTKFAHMLDDGSELAKFVDDYHVEKVKGESPDGGKSWPVMFNVTLKQGISDEKQADAIARFIIKDALSRYVKEDGAESNVYVEPDVQPQLKVFRGHWQATFPAFVIPKHPTHIYESLCYLFGFVLLMFLYYRTNLAEKKGFLFGLYLIITFLSRFLIEFVKENQVGFEKGMSLNMGQWLSIPFVLAGIILMIRPFIIKTKESK
ncbi:prolipoprotein diacylglyceryl transferase [Saccharicrinis sp. FJH54]|uniref:prolipoprotein diacylglyceryl transferase n=1 Tax=Saccharicrinis sp. FJH54 TaxID=3344665 RepID=UPI0035D4A3E5